LSEALSRRWRPLDLINVTTPYFEKRGIDNPRLNAERLLAHALEWTRLDLYTRFDADLSEEQVTAFRELVRRRGQREPLQHILKETEFRSLEFVCDARVLAPRPETELLVDEVLRRAEGLSEPLLADIGTGSGCIAVCLAKALPGASVVATDVSLDALEVALGNVEAHGVTGRVRLLEGDLAAPLLAEGYGGRIDVVACNPPYVASGEFEALQPEVRDFEPRLALDGGPDGLRFYQRFFQEVRPLVTSRGLAVLELAEDGADAVKGLAERSGWSVLDLLADHAGIRRVLTARAAPGG